jgi:hypothetical protein
MKKYLNWSLSSFRSFNDLIYSQIGISKSLRILKFYSNFKNKVSLVMIAYYASEDISLMIVFTSMYSGNPRFLFTSFSHLFSGGFLYWICWSLSNCDVFYCCIWAILNLPLKRAANVALIFSIFCTSIDILQFNI